MSKHECPTCDRADFESFRGMKMHHAYSHDESLSFDTYTCDYCGDTFERQITKVDSEEVYCNNECRGQANRVELSKKTLYEWYWGEKLTSYEIVDGRPFSVQVIKNRAEEYGIPLVGEVRSHNAWLFLQRPKKWHRNQYLKENKSTYQIAAENNVSQEWVRRKYREWNIPLRNSFYKNSTTEQAVREDYNYGPNWESISESIRAKNDYRCQACGVKQSEIKNALQVHHIRSFRLFESRKEANREENLIPLCYNCHNKWENIPVQPSLI